MSWLLAFNLAGLTGFWLVGLVAYMRVVGNAGYPLGSRHGG